MIAAIIIFGAIAVYFIILLVRDYIQLRKASREYKQRRADLQRELADLSLSADAMYKEHRALYQGLLASSKGIPSGALQRYPDLKLVDQLLSGRSTDTSYPATARIRYVDSKGVLHKGKKDGKYSILRRWNRAGVPVVVLTENTECVGCEGRDTFGLEVDGMIVCLVGPLRNSLFNNGYGNN